MAIDEQILRYQFHDFTFFKMSAIRHLGYINILISNSRLKSRKPICGKCKILWRSAILLLSYGDLTVFNMAPSAIINFLKFKFLTADKVEGANMRHPAKFGADRTNRCWDNGDFLVVLNGRHSPSWICFAVVWAIHGEYLVVLFTLQNSVGIGTVILIIGVCKF